MKCAVPKMVGCRLGFDEDATCTRDARLDLAFDCRRVPFDLAQCEPISELDTYVYENIIGALMHRKDLVDPLDRGMGAEHPADFRISLTTSGSALSPIKSAFVS